MKPNFKKTEGNKLIAIVGDEVPMPFIEGHSHWISAHWNRGEERARGD